MVVRLTAGPGACQTAGPGLIQQEDSHHRRHDDPPHWMPLS